jgi:hypothetical protein
MEFYKIKLDESIELDLKKQSEKISEELQELLVEVDRSMDNTLTYLEELTIINNMYAETFDIIQSCFTFLQILETCCNDDKNIIEKKYVKHIEKLLERKWKLEKL